MYYDADRLTSEFQIKSRALWSRNVRPDDICDETINRRFDTFDTETVPALESIGEQWIEVIQIDAKIDLTRLNQDVDKVIAAVNAALEAHIAEVNGTPPWKKVTIAEWLGMDEQDYSELLTNQYRIIEASTITWFRELMLSQRIAV